MLEAASAQALREWVDAQRGAGERIALVPTMGNLHAGHMSLMQRAAEHADRVVCSIFVNPTQFAPGEDYERYPRTPREDRERLRAAAVDVLFAPSVDEVYPSGVQAAIQMRVPRLGEILCAEQRPGHFDGVVSVVLRLFNLVRPDVAVFGEKDFQQFAIVRHLVRDLSLPVEVVGAPTLREADGLALSSRNQYLTEEERRRAPCLYASLQRIRAEVQAGATDFRRLEGGAVQELRDAGLLPEYVEIRDAQTLERARPGERPLVALAAAKLGRARLIDNLRLN